MIHSLKRGWQTQFPIWYLLTIWTVGLNSGCSTTTAQPQSVPTYQVRVIATFPHDPKAFTQGFIADGDTFYEGTGQYGNSTLRRVDAATGQVQAYVSLDPKYFGEGIALFNDHIYQLTWKERVCFVFERESMKAIGSLPYSGQGWGLTADDQFFYMSDGTSTIRVLDPSTFKQVRRIRVRAGRRAVDQLNELEFVDGKILANIWYLDRLAQIDPQTGQVLAWIDCSHVFPNRPNREHVLNGIAYDAQSGRLFITGKNWPKVYEIEILYDR